MESQKTVFVMPVGQCKLNALDGCAAITGIVGTVRTGASMFTCAFVTSILYPTILTAINRICIKFKCKSSFCKL